MFLWMFSNNPWIYHLLGKSHKINYFERTSLSYWFLWFVKVCDWPWCLDRLQICVTYGRIDWYLMDQFHGNMCTMETLSTDVGQLECIKIYIYQNRLRCFDVFDSIRSVSIVSFQNKSIFQNQFASLQNKNAKKKTSSSKLESKIELEINW